MKYQRMTAGRKHGRGALPVIRQQAGKAIRERQVVHTVVAAYDLNVRGVFRRLAAFANGVQKARLSRTHLGRPPKVGADEMHWLARALKEHTPQQFRFSFGLWTLSLIAALIEREFGKKLSLASVSRIMELLWFSAQKALYQAWQQDAPLVRMWENDTYQAIRA